MDLQGWTNVATIVGTAVSAATLGFGLWVAKTALPSELEKFRSTKREEKRAEVAQTLWVAVFRQVLALQQLSEPMMRTPKSLLESVSGKSRGEQFMARVEDRHRMVIETANELVHAWGLAEVFLPDLPVLDALMDLWSIRGRMLTQLDMYAMQLDQPTGETDAWDFLFGGAARAEVDACFKRLRGVLGPVARHELPVPATAPIPPTTNQTQAA